MPRPKRWPRRRGRARCHRLCHARALHPSRPDAALRRRADRGRRRARGRGDRGSRSAGQRQRPPPAADAGIRVECGVHRDEAEELNAGFLTRIRRAGRWSPSSSRPRWTGASRSTPARAAGSPAGGARPRASAARAPRRDPGRHRHGATDDPELTCRLPGVAARRRCASSSTAGCACRSPRSWCARRARCRPGSSPATTPMPARRRAARSRRRADRAAGAGQRLPGPEGDAPGVRPARDHPAAGRGRGDVGGGAAARRIGRPHRVVSQRAASSAATASPRSRLSASTACRPGAVRAPWRDEARRRSAGNLVATALELTSCSPE